LRDPPSPTKEGCNGRQVQAFVCGFSDRLPIPSLTPTSSPAPLCQRIYFFLTRRVFFFFSCVPLTRTSSFLIFHFFPFLFTRPWEVSSTDGFRLGPSYTDDGWHRLAGLEYLRTHIVFFPALCGSPPNLQSGSDFRPLCASTPNMLAHLGVSSRRFFRPFPPRFCSGLLLAQPPFRRPLMPHLVAFSERSHWTFFRCALVKHFPFPPFLVEVRIPSKSPSFLGSEILTSLLTKDVRLQTLIHRLWPPALSFLKYSLHLSPLAPRS